MLALDSYLWFVVIVWATYLPVSSSPVLQLEFFEGDIIRLKATGTSKQTVHYNAISGDEFRWPNATIPYSYDIAEFGDKFVDEFGAAIIDIHQNTCVRFRPKTDSDRHHVIVKNLDGCWSFVGRQKDLTEGQEMSLAQVCWTRGTLVHEIMHLLGFYHEHSRFDRDDYIRIIYDNIQQTRRGQFVKRSPESTDLLTEYDYNSTLHYAWNAWAIDPDRPTIIPKKHKAEIGQRVGLSQLDYEKINKLYKCDDHSTPQISTTTPTAAPVAQLAPQCPTDSQADCQDDRRDCAVLASRGYCEKVPGLMLSQCRRTCCNCDYSRCFDTTDARLKQQNCLHVSYSGADFTQFIGFPNSCTWPHTAIRATNFCPRLCGVCRF